MTKPVLEYVFSGCNMMELPPRKHETCDITNKIIENGISKIRYDINKKLPMFEVKLSLLYNAYVEPLRGQAFGDFKYGFDRIFADSGGLQIITRGLQITNEQKTKVYEKQSPANFSMCFDEIPVETCTIKTSRATVADKKFIVKRKSDCARITSLNVKEQIDKLSPYTHNKVVHIIQGNNAQDMIEWADISFKNFDSEKIGGLAMAGTCIGNGAKETIEMLCAYKKISEKYNFSKQLHLLGVGSLERLKPVLNLLQSGYIDKTTIVSFDSSSASMSLMMGRLVDINGVTIEVKKGVLLENHINDFIDFFYDIISTHIQVTKKEIFVSLYDNIESLVECAQANDLNKSLVPLLVAFNLIGFFKNINDYVDTIDNSPIGLLRNVETDDDMNEYNRQYGYLINSKRIYREENFTLDEFFQ